MTSLDANATGMTAILSNGSVIVESGGSLALTGTNDTITLRQGASLSLANNNDTVTLGNGSSVTATGTNDTFVFQPSFGHDTITGYVASGAGADTINVDHTEFADWAHLLAGATQSGGDVLLTANANDSILLKNTTLASLQQSQFHFT